MIFFDPSIIIWLQSLLPYWAWDLLNLLGDDIIYVALLGIAYWCINKKQGTIAVNLLMFSSFFNVLFKYAFRMERPPTSLRSARYATDMSYGFPSGAAQSSATFWGWASVKLRRWYIWIVGTVFIIITALARMGLGLHWLGDVIGGIVIGIVIVAMAYFLVPFFDKRWERMPRALQDWLLPIMALVFFAIYYVAYYVIPVIPYFPTENIGVSMGVVFGFGTGVALETHYVNLKMDVPRNTKILRAVLGLIIALVLYFTFTVIFGFIGIAELFAARFVKYALVGFFGAFVIPALFKAIHR
jgi:membrane-associated phospholipid phosphatase